MAIARGTRSDDDRAVGDDSAIGISVGGLRFYLRCDSDSQREQAGPHEPIFHEYCLSSIAAMCGGLWGYLTRTLKPSFTDDDSLRETIWHLRTLTGTEP